MTSASAKIFLFMGNSRGIASIMLCSVIFPLNIYSQFCLSNADNNLFASEHLGNHAAIFLKVSMHFQQKMMD